ncbi:MAG: DUF2934 domain-containing protein [Chlorobium sp.]
MKSKSTKGEVTSPEQREEEIRLIAYYLWESKGSRNGSDIDDWIIAERGLYHSGNIS